jgi:hypothetical protein
MKLRTLVLPALAVGIGAALLLPSESVGYSTIGGSLSQSQRDFRIFDNFGDSQANNNTTPDANWPGYTGAELAIWKGCVEWASVAHGPTGAGDPTQTAVGGSDANFDPSFQGNATQVGNMNENIHSEISGNGGSTLAFTESPISDGWRIRYYEEPWTYQDGPSSPGGGVDLQGVAAHEYGHALGLGHSAFGGTTMFPTITGTGVGQRSIEQDDRDGIQFIYGVVDTQVKPKITGTNLVGSTLTINGTNFNSTNNEVWFTQAIAGGNGTPIKVTGLSSGGTQLVLNVPGTAGPGDILVKKGGNSGHSGLSNPWPFDPGQIPTPDATEVNIDLGTTMGVPGTGQGGAPNNVGAWNGIDVPVAGNDPLFDPEQAQTLGTISHSGSAGEFVFDEAQSTGFWEKMFDDGHDIGCSPGVSMVTYTLDGFAAGTYDVYVYSLAIEDPLNSLTNITVVNGLKGTQACGGIPFQESFLDGGNFVFDQVTIGVGEDITIVAATLAGCGRVNGIQVLPGTPCGQPVNYCTAGTSASGCQAVLSASGTPSATAPSGFVIQATGVEGVKDGLFFYSTNGQQAANWGNGTSFQCVVPPVMRAGLISGGGTVGLCNGFFSQDFNALWQSNPLKNPGPGAAVATQLWYRDPANTSNQSTSLSDGLSYIVCP